MSEKAPLISGRPFVTSNVDRYSKQSVIGIPHCALRVPHTGCRPMVNVALASVKHTF